MLDIWILSILSRVLTQHGSTKWPIVLAKLWELHVKYLQVCSSYWIVWCVLNVLNITVYLTLNQIRREGEYLLSHT